MSTQRWFGAGKLVVVLGIVDHSIGAAGKSLGQRGKSNRESVTIVEKHGQSQFDVPKNSSRIYTKHGGG